MTAQPLTWSEAVRELRLRKLQMSQERFAAQVGVSYTTVSRWERGIRVPSPMAQEKLVSMGLTGLTATEV